MRREKNPAAFEVRCQRCQVTFPIGTRTCIHCGERLGRGRPSLSPGAVMTPGPMQPSPMPEPVEEDDLPSRSGVMSPVAILWIVLLLGGAVYRACAAG